MLEQFRLLAERVRRHGGEVLVYENIGNEMIPHLIYRNEVLEGGAEICDSWGVK